ncbi:MAG: hypothetical protein ACREEJ_13775, partial [Ensifer adhaerens]
LPNRSFELRKVRGRLQDRAWCRLRQGRPDRYNIIDIAGSLVMPGRGGDRSPDCDGVILA